MAQSTPKVMDTLSSYGMESVMVPKNDSLAAAVGLDKKRIL